MNIYDNSDGEFFPNINTSDIDLSEYQIFNTINPSNYTDNRFVYACIQLDCLQKMKLDY